MDTPSIQAVLTSYVMPVTAAVDSAINTNNDCRYLRSPTSIVWLADQENAILPGFPLSNYSYTTSVCQSAKRQCKHVQIWKVDGTADVRIA